MGVKVQTRYQTTYTVAMTDVQTTMDVDTAPANSIGYVTVRRGYPDQEDIKYQGTSGLQLTNLLRGLSPVALTDTEVIGLKKPHTLNSPSDVNTVEGTTLHYIINNKTSVDSNETVTGAWVFSHANGLQVTNGIKTSVLQYDPNSINDVGGLPILGFTGVSSAVNYLRFKNAITGEKPVLEAVGTDTNIIVEFFAKGTGYYIIPDGSQLKTSAAPVNPQDIVNKAYVDAQISASSVGNASTTQKGVAEEATLAEVAAGTGTGGSGARLFINPSSTTAGAGNVPGAIVILGPGGVIPAGVISIETLYAPSTDLLGETFSASDITNNNNLAYQKPNDNRWWKVPAGNSIEQYYRLGLVLQAGNAGNAKPVLLKGTYTGKAFPNINPTFTANTAGGGTSVGLSVGSFNIIAYRLSNDGKGQCELGTGTIRAKRQGSPAGALGYSIFLENNSEQSGQKPACYGHSTPTNQPLGAILGSSSIPAANFAAIFQDHAVNFGGLKIPPGVNFYLVLQMLAVTSASDYYVVEGGLNAALVSDINGTWGGTGTPGYYTINTNSVSPIGHAVKIGNGLGNYGVEGYRVYPWSRVIGRVTGANSFYFDPEEKRRIIEFTAAGQSQTQALNRLITTNFCPNELHVKVGRALRATTSVVNNHYGYIRGNRFGGSSFNPNVVTGNSNAYGASFPADDFLNYGSGGITGNVESLVPAMGSSAQNYLHAVRYEDGVRIYSGYPGGVGNVQQNAAGFVAQTATFDLEIE